MFQFNKTRVYLLILITVVTIGSSYADSATLINYLNSLRTNDSSLPSAPNQKGQFGYILAEIFNVGGKIKSEYLDYSGISAWTQSGTITYLTASTGSVGIGTSNPGGYTTAIRGSNDIAGSGALWVSGFSATTPGLMVRNDGNVGIGTASPSAKLHIQNLVGTRIIMDSSDNTSYSMLAFKENGAVGGFVEYINSNFATVNRRNYLELGSQNINGGIALWAGNSEKMRIDSTGNVGIGTVSPASKLHIIHSDSVTEDQSTALTDVGIGLRIQNVTAGQVGIGTKNSVGGPYEGDFIVYNQWFNGTQYVWKERMRVRSDGNVGIGTTNPYGKLDVVGSGDTKINLGDNTDANRGIILKSGTSVNLVSSVTTNSVNRELALGVNEIEYMRIKNNGYVGIGVTGPTYRLQLPNTPTVAGQGQANAWVTYSDGRVKTNKENIGYGISEIMKIEPKQYFHHSSEFQSGSLVVKSEGRHTIGFIAQDLQKVIPEAVNKPKDDSKELWSVDYNKLVPILVNAMKEQQRQIEKLTDEVRELRKK